MCGRATLRIELSTPCMMFAIMIEIVIMPRLGTGANGSPFIRDPPRTAYSFVISVLTATTCCQSARKRDRDSEAEGDLYQWVEQRSSPQYTEGTSAHRASPLRATGLP